MGLLSVCIALRLWKDLLILPCAKYKNHDQIVSAILGPGHGAFLREYVDGSDDQPILQGNETSLKRGSAVMARRKKNQRARVMIGLAASAQQSLSNLTS